MSRFSTCFAITGAAVALAGCGGGGGSPSTPGHASTSSAPKPSGKTSGTFSTGDIGSFGTILLDAKSRTVYVLTSDKKKNLPCTGASGCAKVWLPLALPDGKSAASAGYGLDESLLGTMKGSDGRTYPTYNGYLMYEYSKDTGPGDYQGEGIKSFGGTWYVLGVSGKPVKSAALG